MHKILLGSMEFWFLQNKPGALHPDASSTSKARMCFFLFGLWPKIQASRFAGGS
jgi:hypothetical protein